ncbi:MAG: NlpC/P60 family protein [Flavobacteriaceae bacterium]|nr:NlpC/P60 family protein [Flavobacteriaceae bacterium]
MLRIANLLLFITTFFIAVSFFNNNLSEKFNNGKATEEIDREDVLNYAKTFLGTPYCYACSDPGKGFDCSGFVNFVFKNFSIKLPRSSRDFKDLGPALNPEEFKVGDILVFYGFKDSKNIGHVGIISEADGMDSIFDHMPLQEKNRGDHQVISAREAYSKRFYKCIDVIR